jgi:hypothetical protein
VLVGAFAIPTTFGQNALRLTVLLGPPLLVLAARPRAPRVALVACGLALVYLQWLPAVRAVARGDGGPVDASGVLRRPARVPRAPVGARRARRGRLHQEPLGGRAPGHRGTARAGWERQLDQKVNPLFYDDDTSRESATRRG